MVEHITILKTQPDFTAGKTYEQIDGQIKEVAYRAGQWFSPKLIEMDGIDDLYGALVELEQHPRCLMIHGKVKAGFAEHDLITRTLHDDPCKRQTAMLEPQQDGDRWVMLDFDKQPLAPGLTPAEGVERLVQQLSAEFRDASYCYQLSSSAGVYDWDKLSAHVFFVLATPFKGLAQWGKNFNAVRIQEQDGRRLFDPSPLETVQPNFTARPTFIGMDDPVGRERCGLVRKARDEVDLQWIDKPVRYVQIDSQRVAIGSTVMRDGIAFIATPSLQDRFDRIGIGNEYREPLKQAIAFYFWYHGSAGSVEEIKRLLHQAFPAGIKDYLRDYKLNDLVNWFAKRATQPPVYQDRLDKAAAEAALRDRMIQMRANATPFADLVVGDFQSWVFDMEDTGLAPYYIGDECGSGKTEWLIGRLNNRPRRYIVCLPRIDLIREVSTRLEGKYPFIRENHNYIVKTIYTERDNDIRDAEDQPDIHSGNTTVRQQVTAFREEIGRRPHVVLFITHAALMLVDWIEWSDFDLLIDEVPDPYAAYSRNFTKNGDLLKRYVDTYETDDETNYYRLCLTQDGHKKVTECAYDDIDTALRGLLESINTPNIAVYATKAAWDDMQQQRVHLMRLIDAWFLKPFVSITIMGDEFTRSTLALSFENKFAVEWRRHPDWKPDRVRKVALKDRVRLFYFASKEARRGSISGYDEHQVIPKLLAWFDQPENDPGQVLITSNRRFEHCFERPSAVYDGVWTETVMREAHYIRRLWVPPKMAGTDIYKNMTNVAFFAAMRPSGDEKVFVERALLIDEEAIIRWREYNALYQFVMRIALRKFDANEVCNVYVYDEYQAEYLRERFGGCLEYRHLKGVADAPLKKNGRKPKRADGQVMSSTERSRIKRQKQREAAIAARHAPKPTELSRSDSMTGLREWLARRDG